LPSLTTFIFDTFHLLNVVPEMNGFLLMSLAPYSLWLPCHSKAIFQELFPFKSFI